VRVDGLHQVAQKADDLDASVAFYRDVLGLHLVARFDPPGLVFFDLGGTRLLLEQGAPPALLYLHVDDLDATHAALVEAGVVFETDPHTIFTDDEGRFGPAGEEERMAFLRDPAGNLIALATRR
jgi:methylmalonyl-CoA/ethylmalonyl-CoA epimerase